MRAILLALLAGLEPQVSTRTPAEDPVDRALQAAPADPAGALEELDRVRSERGDRPEVLRALAFVHLWLRDLDAARDFGERAARELPADPYLRLWLGNVAFWRGRLDEARRRYEEATSLAPDEGLREDLLAKRAQVEAEIAYRGRVANLRRRAVLAAALALGGALIPGVLLGAGLRGTKRAGPPSRRALPTPGV